MLGWRIFLVLLVPFLRWATARSHRTGHRRQLRHILSSAVQHGHFIPGMDFNRPPRCAWLSSGADWEIREPSTTFNKDDAQTLEFRMPLRPNQEGVATYHSKNLDGVVSGIAKPLQGSQSGLSGGVSQLCETVIRPNQ